MKRTLSLILAALLLASSITACGKSGTKETENATSTSVVETQAAETNAPATDAPETQAPVPSYDTSLITENGIAKAHIVMQKGCHLFRQLFIVISVFRSMSHKADHILALQPKYSLIP